MGKCAEKRVLGVGRLGIFLEYVMVRTTMEKTVGNRVVPEETRSQDQKKDDR